MTAIDDILHDFIVDKISEIKSNPALLDQIFVEKSTEQREQIKQYFLNNDIRIVKHHPRDPSEWPCYSVVLDSSTETDQTIGSSGANYDEIEISRMTDGWIGSDSDIFQGTWSSPSPSGIDYPWMGAYVGTIAYSVNDCIGYKGSVYVCIKAGTGQIPNISPMYWSLVVQGNQGSVDVKQFYTSVITKGERRLCRMTGNKTASLNKGIWIDLQRSVLEGGAISLINMDNLIVTVNSNRVGTFLEFGFGQKTHREQTKNFTVSVKNLWEKVKVSLEGIANRDKQAVRFMSIKIIDADAYTDIYMDTLRAALNLGNVMEEAFINNNYRIECWSENADLTLIMYNILMWNVLRYRTYFETTWGLLEQRLEGGDISPQTDLYPAIVYVRALMYSCKTIEIYPREGDLYALDIKVGRVDWSGGV
jgi:hypothetical protein